MSDWQRDDGGLPAAPPGQLWLRFMGGPLDGWRRLSENPPRDAFVHYAPPDPDRTRYVRNRQVEQLDIEAIYYPERLPEAEAEKS